MKEQENYGERNIVEKINTCEMEYIRHEYMHEAGGFTCHRERCTNQFQIHN